MIDSVSRGLYWKECRQLLPLIAMLVGVGIALVVLGALLSTFEPNAQYAGRFIPLVFPALYAVGAAAVLVGQEKEQNTLWWLASNPIAPSRLIWVKVVVATGGLVLMWILCWAFTFAQGNLREISLYSTLSSHGTFSSNGMSPPLDYLLLHVHSVFLLACGFYAAWRLPTAFTSLLAIVPLAVVPFLLVHMIRWVTNSSQGPQTLAVDQASAITVVVTLLAAFVFAWRAYAVAKRQLMPAEPPRLMTGANGWLDGWAPSWPDRSRQRPFRHPISSLVWQSIHHNRFALAGLVGLTLLGVICFGLLFIDEARDNLQVVLSGGALLGWLGVCWLGVSVFTGDGSDQRLRFLAEFGVAPARVWAGQHLIRVSVLATALLIYGVLSLLSVRWSYQPEPVPSIALLSLLFFVAYGVSQWMGQVVRILAAAAVLSPLVAAVAVYWLGFAASEFRTPIWLRIVCASLPFVATLIGMGRFMDARRDRWWWALAAATVLLVIVIPPIPMMWRVSQFTGMPSDLRARLYPEAKSAWSSTAPSAMISRAEFEQVDLPLNDSLSGQAALEIYKRRSFQPQEHLQIGASADDSPASIDNYVLRDAIDGASLALLRLETSPGDDESKNQLIEWMETLARAGQRLRGSRWWMDQHHADIIEIWLTQTLTKEESLRTVDGGKLENVFRLIGDRQGRSRARRRAVLASWYKAIRDGDTVSYGSIGGFHLQVAESELETRLLHQEFLDAVVAAALRLIELGSQGDSTDSARHELHRLTMPRSVRFEDGPYGTRTRTSADSGHRGMLYRAMFSSPACQWYAPWEEDAAQLAESRENRSPDNPSRDNPAGGTQP